MRILLLGSGGREHAFAWKMSQSPLCEKLFIAPGNPGTAQYGTNVAFSATDFSSITDFVLNEKIDLVVVGPEEPLVKGIRDHLKNNSATSNVKVLGPSKEGAQLEGSKDYAKAFMKRNYIPTAAYGTFSAETLNEARSFLKSLQPPYVLKADGLAAGKGVLILNDLAEAEEELKQMFSGKFGTAGAKVVIEEFLKGIELSVFVLTDGNNYKILPAAKDYKRVGDGDTGLNTGGMGAVSPVPFADEKFLKKVEERIVKPTVEGLKKEQIDYRGFVFIGLMNVNGDPFVIEYNVRMGDPETEVVLPRIKSDLVQLLYQCADGKLTDDVIETDPRTALTVMLVSEGYPGDYPKGRPIALNEQKDSLVFHAGTAKDPSGQLITSGGRVMAITSLANDIPSARQLSYAQIGMISFSGMNFRKDIGLDLL